MSRWFGWLLAVVDAAALGELRPDVVLLIARSGSPHRWLAHAGPDHVAATLAASALWVAAAWVGVGLLAGFAARLPGALGRGARRLSVAVLPLVLRRVLVGTVGLGVLIAPVAAGANALRASGASAPSASGPAALPGPAWPGVPPASASSRPPAPLPAPVWPHTTSTPAHPGTGTPSAPSATPKPPSDRPKPPFDRPKPPSDPPGPSPGQKPAPTHVPWPGRPAAPHERPARDVRVGSGDSLWLLAARRLGPDTTGAEIAAYWPRVYTANRSVIGDDPDLITPGQVLHVPAPTQPERP